MNLSSPSGTLNARGWLLVAAALLALPVVLLVFLVVAAHVGPFAALLGFFIAAMIVGRAIQIGVENQRAHRAARAFRR
jgi:hypothetical protein